MNVKSPIDTGELYRVHAARLRAWAKRSGVRAAECEDVVQEIFLQAHRGRMALRDQSCSLSCLFRIAARVSARHSRQAGAHSEALLAREVLENAPSPTPSPLDNAEFTELIGMLTRSLDLAGPERRRLIMATFVDDLPEMAASDVRAAKPGARWVRLHRARKRVRALLLRTQQFGLPRCPLSCSRTRG